MILPAWPCSSGSTTKPSTTTSRSVATRASASSAVPAPLSLSLLRAALHAARDLPELDATAVTVEGTLRLLQALLQAVGLDTLEPHLGRELLDALDHVGFALESAMVNATSATPVGSTVREWSGSFSNVQPNGGVQKTPSSEISTRVLSSALQPSARLSHRGAGGGGAVAGRGGCSLRRRYLHRGSTVAPVCGSAAHAEEEARGQAQRDEVAKAGRQ